MAPDASKLRPLLSVSPLDGTLQSSANANKEALEDSLECVLQPRVLTNFSYMEQPLKCYLTFQGKRLACNGKRACFMVQEGSSSSDNAMDEFLLLPQANGSVILQNVKTQQILCSSSSGGVYAPKTCHADLEKWTLTQSDYQPGCYTITSFAHPGRNLIAKGYKVETSNTQDMQWKVDILSGEVCFLSQSDQQVQCDLLGNLSMSTGYQGWAGWRLSEAGDGHVRISPWAHSDFYLSSTEQGEAFVTEERGLSELWSIEKPPNGLVGVLFKSVQTGRVLHYNQQLNEFLTVPGAALHLDESCVWDLQSLHRSTYYLVTNNGNRRLEANKRKGITTRGLPGHLSSEEWKIEQSTSQPGVITLFSNARQQCLGSNASGEVFLMEDTDGSSEQQWVIEEREDGFVVLSGATGRVLVSQDKGPICTVEPGTRVFGNTRWKLEPKIPPQISKKKVQKVGAAVAIGVAGTIFTPFLIGGAIGALGIAQVGLAGEVAIGSIRAVEAINTITRVTMSSSQLMISQSSSLSSDSSKDYERTGAISNQRPFCAWRSW